MQQAMKKRWISLYVENDVGVLAKISGLFSGKSYNLKSLTVGETEDPTVSRMTISLMGDDKTFEQIKKQLNRSVEVIKVLDFTELPIHKKEILFIKLHSLKKDEQEEIFRSAAVFGVSVSDYDKSSVILESVKTESENDDILKFYKKYYLSRMEAVRGGSVAIESVSKSER
ncbi:MAG TPA: acetolactate synthase small subunit [Candidatus Borkfalkia avistercoris]|uniref:Acetolactate synthase small subunit n=1 Tax=Candidatus Borkfalkia avistercoris TaxID=2838504 RepID=A0A9D2D0A4_9FIRM|nr:acetolactate synthase small subunit [Candidatus Borkfalkia avistercoris]